VKERYEHFIQIIKGKLEEITFKRNQKQPRKWRTKKIENKEKQPECVRVWGNRDYDKVIGIVKAKLLKLECCKTEDTFLRY
jgi:hypothetical protein